MKQQEILKKLQGGLIVSCQALEDEPLHSSWIMSKMALAAKEGGACGIRANSAQDILAIKKEVSLPVIGIHKVTYPDSDVYITPTIKEVEELVAVGAEIIAIDATCRPRPGGQTLETFFKEVRRRYPDQLFMADTSCFSEGAAAQALGFDIVGTTLAHYTAYTKDRPLPDYELLARYTRELSVPVIAEGGIWETSQLREILQYPVLAVVIGTAITRPRDITRRFVKVFEEGRKQRRKTG